MFYNSRFAKIENCKIKRKQPFFAITKNKKFNKIFLNVKKKTKIWIHVN